MAVEMRSSKSANGYSVVVVNCEVIKNSGVAGPRSQWAVWMSHWQEGRDKPSKKPYNGGRRPIGTDDVDSWLSFDEARKLYEGGDYDGVGVLLSSLPGFIGIDVDDCLDDDGHVLPDSKELIKAFQQLGGYIEFSPSGKGLRQFIKGKLPSGYKEKAAWGEIYDYGATRYLTMTGVIWPDWLHDAGCVIENQKGLESFISQFGEKKAVPKSLAAHDDGLPFENRSVAEVLALLKQHNLQGKVTRLLNGDVSDHAGDHSAADLALACHAAYFSRDPVVIDGVMRGSGLYRPKWDEMRGAETYGRRTIRQCLERQGRCYDDDRAEKAQQGERDKADKARLKKLGADFLVGGIDDLLNGRNQLRTDAWALSELLVRDKRLIGSMCFDQFSGYALCNRPLSEVMQDKAAPCKVGRIDDDHIRAIARWYGREWGLSLKPDQVGYAVIGFAEHVRVNPVTNRLAELERKWDGQARLDDWLIGYCKAVRKTDDGRDVGDYLRAVGSRWVISAVARAFQPGTKADCMLVLEGKQGARKSSAVRLLTEAVGVEYFREGFHLSGSKDDLVSLRGRLVIEWGELSGLGKKDRNELKVFLSQQTDSYRQSYGIHEKDWPRTAVFCGTTNDGGYLADPTGGRRFWPVTVGRIDLDRLRQDAAMIWAEAVVRYKAGERWWFDDDDVRDQRLLAIAQREQEKRIGSTFWSEVAADLADKLVCGHLVYLAKPDELNEALPWEKFSRQQMMTWLTLLANDGDISPGGDSDNDDDKGSVIRISDGTWRTVTDGLKLAGWESTKSNGTMKWSLTVEKRDDLCLRHGRDVGPRIGPMRNLRRNSAESAKSNGEAVASE